MSESIQVGLPRMDSDAAENFALGGKLAMTLLNYLEQHPEIMYELYPNKERFEIVKEQFELDGNVVKEEFEKANRKALMVVSYTFKYIANQVIDYYNLEQEMFSFGIENKLMKIDIDEEMARREKEEAKDELIDSEVFDELHRILGGLN
jgi:hypothetical protein